MPELFDRFSPIHLIGLVATVGGILGWIITTVAAEWRRARVAEIEAALKQQMLDRGMGPGEIEQVLVSNRRGSKGCDHGVDSAASAKVALVRTLTENDYEAADVERILRAFGQHREPGSQSTEKAGLFRQTVAAKLSIVRTMAENGNSAEEIERVLGTFTDDAEWRVDEPRAAAAV